MSQQNIKFAYWVPNVSGGLVVSKIEQRTSWDFDYNRRLAQIAEEAGFDYALSQIRTLPGGDLPIVALTASVFREEQPEILRAGCSDVLFKPLQVDELFAVIAKQIPVEYRYEQSREVVPPKDDDALRAESGRLPQEIRVRLLDAARRLDGDSIEAERLALAAAHPALAKEIGLCLQRFDYAAIAELLAANNGDNDV